MRRVFRPDQSGAAVAVGPLEGAVLEMLWTRGPKLGVPAVHQALCDEGRSISYSAVKAVLNNLADKGWLRKEKLGKVTHFETLLTRDEFDERVTRGVIESLKRNFGSPAIAQFVDEFAIDEDAIAQFERLLAEKKKEIGR